METEYKDCKKCRRITCPEKCFNDHPGSKIALTKLGRRMGKKIHIVGP